MSVPPVLKIYGFGQFSIIKCLETTAGAFRKYVAVIARRIYLVDPHTFLCTYEFWLSILFYFIILKKECLMKLEAADMIYFGAGKL